MAGTCAITSTGGDRYQDGLLRELTFSWTSHTDGVVLITENSGSPLITGYICNMETTPGTGDDAPSAYTATLKKANACVLATKSSASATVAELTDVGWHVHNTGLALIISGAGSANKGTCKVLYRTGD